jgi:hypothetical protein
MGRRRNKTYKFSHKDDPPPNDVWVLAYNTGLVKSFWGTFYIIKTPEWTFRNGWWKPIPSRWPGETYRPQVDRIGIYPGCVFVADLAAQSSYDSSGPCLILGEASLLPQAFIESAIRLAHTPESLISPEEIRILNAEELNFERLLSQELFARGVDGIPSRYLPSYPEGKGERS